MIRFIRDLVRRRNLRPIIRDVPHLLKQRYGAAAFYTAEQVKAAATALKLKDAALHPALAVACSASEFIKANPASTEQDYADRRMEIARLFAIDLSDLNCRSLTHKFRASGVQNPSEPGSLIDRSHHIGPGN